MSAAPACPSSRPIRRVLAAIACAGVVGVVGCGGGGGSGGSGGSASDGTPAPVPAALPMPPATGPGDVGSHFPSAVGDTWWFDAWGSSSEPSQRGFGSVTVTGTRTAAGGTASVFAQRSEPGGGPPSALDVYYGKGPGGVWFDGDSDPADTVTPRLVPHAVLLFPVTAGPIARFTLTGVDLGEDLDADGTNERIDLAQESSVAGFDTVVVPAGTFRDVARVTTGVTATVRPSAASGTVSVLTLETTWMAPGAGIVRRVRTAGPIGGVQTQVDAIEARGMSVGGTRVGMTLPATLLSPAGPVSSGAFAATPETGDTPAVASDGDGFLVVSRRWQPGGAAGAYQVQRVATRVAADGAFAAGTATALGAPVPSNDPREHTALAWGGGVYLAVHEQRNPIGPGIIGPTQPSVVAQRISPLGVALDSAPFELVAPATVPSGGMSREAAVAFGNGAFLVVYCGGSAVTSTTWVEGRLVAPDGTVGPPLRISPDFTYAGQPPVVVFDGTHHVVGWADSGGWRLARVASGATVLDPVGVATQVPLGPIAVTRGDGGLLLAWTDGSVVRARRLRADLAAVDPAPILVAGAGPGGRSALAAGSVGGEYLIAWAEPVGALLASQRVIRLQRIAPDGTVRGQAAPPGALSASGPFAILASASAGLPCCGATAGWGLPAIASGAAVGLLAYVGGSGDPQSGSVHGVRLHPFAR